MRAGGHSAFGARSSQPCAGVSGASPILPSFRSTYGRQLASEVRHGVTSISPEPIEMVFIRAPIIERVGPNVEVLAKSEEVQPVLIRQGHILISTFHPELTSDTTVHEYFFCAWQR